MAIYLNTTTAFTGIDITGTAEAVLTYTNSSGSTQFVWPTLWLEGLNAAAAYFTVEIWISYNTGVYTKIYTNCSYPKDPDASTKFTWQSPLPILVHYTGTDSGIVQIRVLSSNTNDTSIDGNVYLMDASMSLDNISVTEPSGRATNFREMLVQLYM